MGVFSNFKQGGSGLSGRDAISSLVQAGRKARDLGHVAAETGKRAQKTAKDNVEARMPFPDADIQAFARISGRRCVVGLFDDCLRVHLLPNPNVHLPADPIEGYRMAFNAAASGPSPARPNEITYRYTMLHGLLPSESLFKSQVEVDAGEHHIVFGKHASANATLDQIQEYLQTRILRTYR